MRSKIIVSKWKTLHSKLWIFIVLFALTLPANAINSKSEENKNLNDIIQQVVKGTVVDQKGLPLIGVSINVKGTTIGVSTDLDGRFTINNVPQNATTLIISYIGMKTKEIQIEYQKAMIIALEDEVSSLDEVVVVGYGTTRKSDLTGAISSVSSKDYSKQPVFRIDDALQGRAAGVQIIKNSGAPGATLKIRIRGANSISGDNQPLVVLDGMIGADLSTINTNDIASMDILKDASATAIYGSRGANGVILVTTKRGSGKPTINIDTFTSVSTISKKLDLLSPEEFGKFNNLPVIDGGTDYQKAFFTTGYTKSLQVSMSGKEGKTGYFISGNVLDQSGTSINSNYTRYSFRSNLDTKLNDKLSVQLNLNGTSEKSLNLIGDGASSSPDARAGIVAVVGWDPTLPIKGANGKYNLLGNGSGLINPVAHRLESDANATTASVNSNINISYDITPSLNLTVTGGLLYRNVLRENYYGIPSGTALGLLTGSSADGGSNYQTTLQNSNILTWTKNFNKHNVKITGLFENQKVVNKSISANGGEFAIPANFYTINLGTTPSINAGYSQYQIQSWMGRGEYNFDRKLYLTGTVRADISSKFRPENQLGIFPSGSIAYQFSNLFKDEIQKLKLRAGYGEVGNQGVLPYSTYNSLNSGLNYTLNGTTDFRGIGLTGANIGNSNLTWETTKQTNIGTDITFFNGKATFSIDKYWKNTEDLLLAVPVADFLGGGSITQNVGKVFNGGWETSLQMMVVSTDKFDWNFNANYSYNESEVKALYGGVNELFITPLGTISNTTGSYVRVKVGEPLGQFYGATALGTYKTGDTDGIPGRAKYLKDANGVVTSVIGNGVPKHTWALNNTLGWGNFDMNFLLRGSHGFDVMNLTRGQISMAGGAQGGPTAGEYRNRWTAENQTDVPAGGDLILNSTRFIEKGDFVRLSNLAFGYNINDIAFFSKIRINVSAQNLFTITSYKGFDPEASSTGIGSGTASSIDYGANPNSRTFTLGLNLTF